MMSLSWDMLCSVAFEKSKREYAGRSRASWSEERSSLEVEI